METNLIRLTCDNKLCAKSVTLGEDKKRDIMVVQTWPQIVAMMPIKTLQGIELQAAKSCYCSVSCAVIGLQDFPEPQSLESLLTSDERRIITPEMKVVTQ